MYTSAGVSRPEPRMLLSCARFALNGTVDSQIESLLQRPIDWNYLIELGLRHRTIPSLYSYFNSHYTDSVPKQIFDGLRHYSCGNIRRNLFLTGELYKILDRFSECGILAVPFKGLTLATRVYRSLSIRQFDDLDILVPKREVIRARNMLIAQGFRPRFQLNAIEEAAYLESGCAFTLDQDGVTVDLHWEILAKGLSPRFDVDGLWERLQPASLGGRTVLGPPVEDLFLLLCLHGAKHQWARLEWICSLAGLVLVHPAMDWGRVMEQAARMGAKRMVLLGLLLVSGLLGMTLPPETEREAEADPVAHFLSAQVYRGLFAEEEKDDCDRVVEKHAFQLKTRERWRDKGRYFARLLSLNLTPTAKDREQLILPAVVSFVYYLTRPLRLLREYGLGPLTYFVKRLRSVQNP